MNMELKERIKHFNIRENEGIDKDDKNGKISEAFKPIAETILSGHFKVTKNNSDSFVTVHPTCVEMYYHEEGEGEDKIKDYIVYHRNSNDGKKEVSVFTQGVLHNHVSGIDLTFEKLVGGLPVRFSALIREFWIDKSNKKEEHGEKYGEENIKACTESNPEKRSTYLYEALYSQYSVFDGFSVQWVDGNENDRKEISCVKTRLNVAEYEMKDNKDGKGQKPEKIKKDGIAKELLTKNQNYKQCQRMWSYSINEDKAK